MPPKRVKRPGPRPAPTPRKVDLIEQVGSAKGWTEIVDVLRKHHNLADLDTRHGLKAVHKSYPQISKQLNATYIQHQDNENVRIGLIMLWSKLCEDSILTGKLVEEGYLSKVAPLLRDERTQSLALDILKTVAHHSGMAPRGEIIRSAYPALRKTLRVALEDNGQPKTVDLCVTILSHSAEASLGVQGSKYGDVNVDVSELIALFTSALRVPKASINLFRHAVCFIQMAAFHKPQEILPPSPTSALRLLIACLRVDDLQERIHSYFSLYDLQQNCKHIPWFWAPARDLNVAQSGLPSDIMDALRNFGLDRSQFYLSLEAAENVQKALMKCAKDGDLLSMGWSLFKYALLTEFSVHWRALGDEHGEIRDFGWPFKLSDDALPHCAKALRQAGSTVAKNLDAADCLDLKYYWMSKDKAAAAALACRAIERNCRQPFFHYVYAWATNNPKESVQRAKFGLKMCDTTTSNFIRCALLRLAYQQSIFATKAVIVAFNSHKPGVMLEEGVAYLTSAMEDSTTLLKIASPDMPHLPDAIVENILLQLALRGKEISPDLKEVRCLLDQYQFSKRVATILYGRSQASHKEEVFKRVIENYTVSCGEWASTLLKVEASVETPPKVEPGVVNDITAWLDAIHVNRQYHSVRCGDAARKKLAPQELYRCTYCATASAGLKKCGRCQRVVNCSAKCQTNHWSDGHKETCVKLDAGSNETPSR